MKSIFEQIGGTYTLQGDYRLPNLTLPAEDERPIGVWGQRRLSSVAYLTKACYTLVEIGFEFRSAATFLGEYRDFEWFPT